MLLIIGDEIVDRYTEYVTESECADGPVVREVRPSWKQPGGAAAVYEMVSALAGVAALVSTRDFGRPVSYQHRTILDSKTILRHPITFTNDYSGEVALYLASLRSEPSVVLIADYGRGCISRKVVEACLERRWRVVADPHYSTNPDVFDGVWAIKTNRATNVKHRYDMRHTRRCITLAESGMIAHEDGKERHYASTTEQPVFDSVGAGDQVLATIGVMLDEGRDWFCACEKSSRAAGLKCAKRGTTPVSRAELLGN